MNTNEAFSIFAQRIARGEQGVFWCVRDDLVSQDERWVFGVGKPVIATWSGPYPFFSITDWLGAQPQYVHFEEWYSNENPPSVSGITKSTCGSECTLAVQRLVESGGARSHFVRAVQQLQYAQRAGDCWVANLAENFSTPHGQGDSLPTGEDVCALYERFLVLGKRHCGGVVVLSDLQFVSFSPEVFLALNGNTLRVCPIKGTGTQEYLESSAKEKSELMMVTDLLRNDLGMIATRVQVPHERILTQEQGFVHARAVIQAELAGDFTEAQFLALLPAGSISGAPKKRAVELIRSLENFDRGLFTGTFGAVFGPNDAIWNILIRTLFVHGNELSFPVGAGITVQSDAQAEWEELKTKQSILKTLI